MDQVSPTNFNHEASPVVMGIDVPVGVFAEGSFEFVPMEVETDPIQSPETPVAEVTDEGILDIDEIMGMVDAAHEGDETSLPKEIVTTIEEDAWSVEMKSPLRSKAERVGTPFAEAARFAGRTALRSLNIARKPALQGVDFGKRQLERIRVGAYGIDVTKRIGNTFASFGRDIRDSDHKIRTLGIGLTAAAFEVADRVRSMVILIPHVTTEVLNNTHSPVQGALAAMGVLTAWNVLSSESLILAVDEFPQTKEKVQENFPLAIEAFKEILPGAAKVKREQVKAEKQAKKLAKKIEKAEKAGKTLEIKEKVKKEKKETRSATLKMIKHSGKFALEHFGRGGTGIAIGTTAFVLTSSLDNAPKRRVREQYLGVSADAAWVLGLVVAGVGQAIFELPKHNEEDKAKFLYDHATDMKTWYGVAIASMGLQYMASRKRKKEAAIVASAEAQIIDAIPTI
jgi:hypothetical protein